MAYPNPPPDPLGMRRIFKRLYPHYMTRTYTVPPLHLNRVPYRKAIVPGTNEFALVLQHPSISVPPGTVPPGTVLPAVPTNHGLAPPEVLWPQVPPQATPVRVQESDFHDDFGQNHVVTNLQALGEKQQEPMFILSQLNFGHYLNQPAYAAAVANNKLKLPTDLDKGQTKYSDGEADIILFHNRYGVLIGELKSVGRWHSLNNTQVPDSSVADKLKKAVDQLTKSEKVISHLVSDIAPGLTVKTTLFLPYVSSGQLHRVLTSYPQLLQALCQCLGAASQSEAVQRCVCGDQLSDPDTYWDVTPDVMSRLTTWWQQRMSAVDPQLCGPGGDRLYLDIVARFVGPASTVSVHCCVPPLVEVRTAGQAVAELGQRLSWLVTTQEQQDMLTRNPPLAAIFSGPGTGKTVLLVLQGLRWLGQGHDVHVISTDYDALPASRLIEKQLQVTMAAHVSASPRPGTVHVHVYDFYRAGDVDQAVSDLTAAVRGGTLCVIMDEVVFGNSMAGPTTQRLVQELQMLHDVGTVPHLHLWCAGVDHSGIPSCLQQEVMTTPLRSTPAVLREVTPAMTRWSNVHAYSDSGLPAPGDGPAVIRLTHAGAGHTSQWPVDCEACGQMVANTLATVGVGPAGSAGCSLSWRDVFVLTRSEGLTENAADARGRVTSSAPGVVRGLRRARVPVCVLGKEELERDRPRWEREVIDVATAQTDRVTVADYVSVAGLERRVVVWLVGRCQGMDDEYSDEDVDARDRLDLVTRCTTQLVIVEVRQAIRRR